MSRFYPFEYFCLLFSSRGRKWQLTQNKIWGRPNEQGQRTYRAHATTKVHSIFMLTKFNKQCQFRGEQTQTAQNTHRFRYEHIYILPLALSFQFSFHFHSVGGCWCSRFTTYEYAHSNSKHRRTPATYRFRWRGDPRWDAGNLRDVWLHCSIFTS